MEFHVDGHVVTISDGSVDQRIESAVACVFTHRVPLFFPLRDGKIETTKIWREFEANDRKLDLLTPYGRFQVRNRLPTQTHKLYFEAMLSYPKTALTDDSFYVSFTLYDLIRNKLNKSISGRAYSMARRIIQELSDIRFAIEVEPGKVFDVGLIDDSYIEEESGRYMVKFTRAIAMIWRSEHLLAYEKSLPALASVNDAVVSATIRYLLTFDSLSISVDSLCEKLYINTLFSRQSVYSAKKRIRRSFAEKEFQVIYNHFGITYDPESDTVIVARRNVYVDHPGRKSFSTRLIEASRKR